MRTKGQVAVIGAGFGGMSAAILLSRAGFDVDLYERQERIGKKLLLTGNGRCNLSNEDTGPGHYLCADENMLKTILDNMSTGERDDFYHSLGLSTCIMKGGIYPVSRQASSVLDVFRFTLEELGVKIILEKKAEEIRCDRRIVFSDGSISRKPGYDHIIIACGGKAGVYSEERENGFGLIKKAGHSINATYPALTFFKCEEDIKALAGVRCDAALKLKVKDKEYRESGEIQFTKENLSGIPVFQLSRYVKEPSKALIYADFLCFLKDPRKEFDERVRCFGERSLEEFFAGWLNKKLALYLIKEAGLKADMKVRDCDMSVLYKLSSEHCFKLRERGGYRDAQLMCGGVPLNEVNSELMSKKAENVYLMGELLDVAGECGGYNLHFALSCAFTVYKSLIKKGDRYVQT